MSELSYKVKGKSFAHAILCNMELFEEKISVSVMFLCIHCGSICPGNKYIPNI